MSAQERNDAVVQANTKQLEVPTFNKKEIEKIVVDTAKKDDVPLGYQIITIDLKDTVGGEVYQLPTNTEDEKLLHEIIVNRINYKKPILLNCINLQGSSDFCCGFVTLGRGYFKISDGYGYTILFEVNDTNVNVTVQEL